MGLTDGGFGGEVDAAVLQNTVQGTFQLFTDDEGHSFNATHQFFALSADGDGVVPGDGLSPGQKLPFQPPGDQNGLPNLEEHMALTLVDLYQVLALPANLLHLRQRGAGNHELKGAVAFFDRLPAQGQAEAVHRH